MKPLSNPNTPAGTSKFPMRFPATKEKNTPKISPLTPKFWNDLIRLEEELKQRTYTFGTIDELVQLYAKAIEFYYSMKDPIKVYFMEKIQITLSSKESLKLIINEKEKEKEQKLRSTAQSTNTSRRNSEIGDAKDLDTITLRSRLDSIAIDEISDDEDEDVKTKELAKLVNDRRKKERQSFSKTKLERAQFVNMFVKVQNNKKEDEKFCQKMIQEFELYTLQNDQIVRNDLSVQIKGIRQRLEQKKLQTFINQSSVLFQKVDKSKSANCSIHSDSNLKKREKKIDEILDELDANDGGKFISTLNKIEEVKASNFMDSPEIDKTRTINIRNFSPEGLEEEEKNDNNNNNRSLNSLSPIRKSSFEQPKMNFEITLSFTKDQRLEEDKQVTSPTLQNDLELQKANFIGNDHGEKIKHIISNHRQIDSPKSEFQLMSKSDSDENA